MNRTILYWIAVAAIVVPLSSAALVGCNPNNSSTREYSNGEQQRQQPGAVASGGPTNRPYWGTDSSAPSNFNKK